VTLDLSVLLDPAASVLAVALLVFLRVGAALFLLPAFGEMILPVRVRLMAALAFTAIVLPAVEDPIAAVIRDEPYFAILAANEVGAGILIGLSLRLLVFALHVAASIAAQATSLSQLLGGAAVDPQPALGLVLLWGALALAASMGLHVRFAVMFIQSYSTAAAGNLPPASDAIGWLVPAVAHSFKFAFLAAMPFVAASLIYNLTLGVINKAMPQLMVAFVGAPAITLGALVILCLSAPLILSVWIEEFRSVMQNPFGAR
jgi:flagellar biosynthetic protein FliR